MQILVGEGVANFKNLSPPETKGQRSQGNPGSKRSDQVEDKQRRGKTSSEFFKQLEALNNYS
ncbi:MAG: hypothetical protein WC369_02215 [Dehalococcoidales bacterium]|jgi:hypothetical protein